MGGCELRAVENVPILAPLARYMSVGKPPGVWGESHALGMLGRHGSGSLSEAGPAP